MIISFDGNVFTGKTSVIKKLSERCDFNYIPEHSDFLDKIIYEKISDNHSINEQLRYIKIDSLRQGLIAKSVNLLDRSFLSMSAHVYALLETGKMDIRKWYIDKLQEYLDSGKIIIPDKYVYATCDYGVIKRRFDNDTAKGTNDIYVEKEYFNSIDKFNKIVLKKLPSFNVDTEVDVDYSRIVDFISKEQGKVRKDDIAKILIDIMM